MIRRCGFIGCDVVIFIGVGAGDTNRCAEHQGKRNEPELDEQFIERVCQELGWRRARR